MDGGGVAVERSDEGAQRDVHPERRAAAVAVSGGRRRGATHWTPLRRTRRARPPAAERRPIRPRLDPPPADPPPAATSPARLTAARRAPPVRERAKPTCPRARRSSVDLLSACGADARPAERRPHVPTCSLPSDPSLEHLRNQAKRLQRLVRERSRRGARARARVPPAPGRGDGREPGARRLLARRRPARRGASLRLPELEPAAPAPRRRRALRRAPHRQAVGGPIADDGELADEFLRLACLVYSNDDPARWQRAAELLAEHPELGGRQPATRPPRPATSRRPSGCSPPTPAPARARAGRTAGSRCSTPPTRVLARPRPGSRRWRWRGCCCAHGADPNAGYLWEGLPSPFTALTGAFGARRGRSAAAPARARRWRRCCSRRAPTRTTRRRSTTAPGGRATRTCELLLRHGFGRGDGGPWHARLGPAHPTPPGACAGRADLGASSTTTPSACGCSWRAASSTSTATARATRSPAGATRWSSPWRRATPRWRTC